MAMNPIDVKPRAKEGGGLFGKVLGGLGGAIVGAAAGGPAGAATGFGLGSSLGGTAGEVAKPSSFSGEKGVPLRASANRPDVQMVMLDEAKKIAQNDPRVSTEDANYLSNTYSAAQDALRKRMTGYGA